MTHIPTSKFSEVRHKADAVTNVSTYNDGLNRLDVMAPKVRDDLLRTISMARAWFAVQQGKIWYVAPAKYAGFLGMTPTGYADNRKNGIDGTRGEIALKRIAGNTPVDKAHPAFRALTALAVRFDRTPSKLAYVYVLHEEIEVEQHAPLPILVEAAVEAVIRLAANLPLEGVTALKRRVATL